MVITDGVTLHTKGFGDMIDITADGHTILLPRSGDGWEIAFPSGNRCWRPVGDASGALRCQVLIPDGPPD